MVARASRCDPDRLRLLLEDRLGEPEQAGLAGHLEACESCRQALEAMAAESRWWAEARQCAGEAAPTSGPDPSDTPGPWLGFLDPPDGPGQLGKIGAYEVVEVIGRGGMGVVLKAFDRPLGRFVAIKVLAPELAAGATARRRFAREAQAVAAIAHEHIVAIHAVDATPAGLPFIVMNYVSGRSLQDRLDRAGPMEVREILRIGMQAASGLAAAHAVGLVHRDVKPANILLENCIERVKLTDFGLARAADDASLTQSGVVAGTPQYMAPEQARGEPVDVRADLFSLGSVLYALCTGRPPFRAETTMGVLRRVCEDTPRPIRETNPEVPDWLQAIVEKLQAKDPAGRFGSAAEVAELFGRCLAYLERPGKQPPFRADRPPSPRPYRTRAIAAALLLAAVAGLGASEATGITRLSDLVATVLRIRTADGTLVLQVDDPEVKVRVDGEDVILTGAGQHEIRLSLRAGQHRLEKAKGGEVRQELVTIARGGKETVRVTFEPGPAPAAVTDAGLQEPRIEQLQGLRDQIHRQLQQKNGEATVQALRDRIRSLEDEMRRIEEDRRRLMSQALRPRHLETPPMAMGPAPGAVAPVLPADPLDAPGGGRAEPGLPADPFAMSPLRPDRRPSSAQPGQIRPPTAAYSAAISPDGKTLAVGCYDGAIRLYDPASRAPKGELRGHTMEVRSVAFSPDGKTLASAGGDYRSRDFEKPGELKLWDVAEGRLRKDLVGHTALVWSVAFSPDGETLASGSMDRTARLWDAGTGKPRAVLEGHRDAVRFVAFAPVRRADGFRAGSNVNGPTLATAGFDGEIRFWHDAPGRPEDGKLWSTHSIPGISGLSCIAFSPDNKTLAISPRPVSDHANEIILLDLATWKERARLKGHPNAVLTLAYSPDGEVLASGGGTFAEGGHSGEVILWDAVTGRPGALFGRLGFWIESVAFTPDGKALIGAGGVNDEEGEVHFWVGFRPATRRPRARLDSLKGQRIWSIAYSPDGKAPATATWGGINQFWGPNPRTTGGPALQTR